MKLITYPEIKNLDISMDDMISWVIDALRIKADVILPPKTSLKPAPSVFFNYMPCIIPQENIAGVKVVSRHPGLSPSLIGNILLCDLQTGEPIACLDGDYITTARTGIVAAISISLLAKKDFKKISFIGLGNTARATCDALASIYKDKELHISLLQYKDQADLFIERFKGYENLKFKIETDLPSMFSSSDIIVSCISYADDIFADLSCYKSGCLIVPVHTRGFQNCDSEFDLVVCDDISHISGFGKFNEMKKVAELSDILENKCAGRVNDSDRIIAYNIGIALHDMYFASKISKLVDGFQFDFCGPAEKFWW